jgi:hypothetical protein
MPCIAAQVCSATTAITSPSFTTCVTPRTASAASLASGSTMRPPSTGAIATSATLECGGRTSMPNFALPFTFAGVSRLGVARPMSRKFVGSLSGGGGGTGNAAAALASAP